jgi:hypothetical protein
MRYPFSPLAVCRRALISTTAVGLAALGAAALATGAAQAATLPTVTATVSPTAITISGALQSGAVNISSTGTGKEPDVTLILLKPGVSVAELYAFLDSNKVTNEANLVDPYGSIVFDQEAGKGKPSEVQTVLVPGQYVALSGEGEKSVKWPRTSFTIAPSPTPAALPAAQATEKTIDFGFKGPTVLKVGELVRFENEGFLVHMDIAFPVTSKKAAKQVVKALSTGREKGLEKLIAGEPINFAGPVSSGAFQQATIAAKPGWYVQACFMTTQDGRPHTLIGMERIIKIVK